MSSSTPPPSSTESPEMEKSRPTNGTTKEKESSVSRAFEPRKQSGVNEAWIKERGAGVLALRLHALQVKAVKRNNSAASKCVCNHETEVSDVEKAQTLPANNTASSGQNSTLRGSKGQHSPFTFHPPQAQSTPKAQHNNQIKKTPSYQPREGLVWPRVQMPQMGGYRAASAMGGGLPAGCRPASRASEVALGHCVGSRYQSYCTLPRPEQFDPLDAEMAFAAAAAFPGDAFRPPPNRVISRPPSALPVLGGDFIRAPAIYPAAEHAVESRMSVAGARPIISWGTLSILGSLQILVGLMIFCLGLARHFMRAKWAIGVELAFSLLVVLAGVTGLMASRRRSPSFASASFAFTASSLVFAVFPFVLGIVSSEEVICSIFVSENEPVDVDLALSAFVLVSVLLSLAVSVLACRSAGRAFSYVDKLRLAAEVNAVYEEKPTKKM